MQEKTYGGKLVGIDFNPGKNALVDVVKGSYADVIDQMNILRSATDSPEIKRLCSVAITEAQTAQMWAVKALTWTD